MVKLCEYNKKIEIDNKEAKDFIELKTLVDKVSIVLGCIKGNITEFELEKLSKQADKEIRKRKAGFGVLMMIDPIYSKQPKALESLKKIVDSLLVIQKELPKYINNVLDELV